MRACAHEDNQTGFLAVVQFVGQKEVAADVAFPVSVSIAAQWMIEPFRAEWPVIGDQQEHGFL